MILHKHNPNWVNEFKRLESLYLSTLGDLTLRIEHIGSTAIKAISAKPILDIDIVIAKESDFITVKKKLEDLGYIHNGDQGIPGREAFIRRNNDVPYKQQSNPWANHHLYVCENDSRELKRHILFRDYLNTHPSERSEYESIKKHIEKEAKGDRKTYARIKESNGPCTTFIERILKKAEESL